VAKVVSGDGADESHDKHRKKLQPARPHQIPSNRQHCLLRDWHSNISENDHQEDPRVAPVRDELIDVGHDPPRMRSSFTLERTPDPLRRGRVGDVSPTGWLPPDHRLSVRGGVRTVVRSGPWKQTPT